MKAALAAALVAVFSVQLLAVDGNKAVYVGGTFIPYAASKDPIEGKLDTTHPDALLLMPDKKAQELRIPYAEVIDLEYGQKAGRRVGVAVATTVLLGPVGLVSLFSKKRNHYLTIGYHGEDGMDQVAVLELGKDVVRTTLAIVETRSGKKITYQDEDAKKASAK